MTPAADKQCTIARARSFVGVALHSGRAVGVCLRPLAEDRGIVFRRADLGAEVRAHCDHVGDTWLATVLRRDGAQIGTVEHLMSALSALGIDNLLVETDASELPILDGSAAPWLLILSEECGILPQKKNRRRMRVTKPVAVAAQGGRADFAPATTGRARYAVTIDYPDAVVRRSRQYFSYSLDGAVAFEKEIGRARTFCRVGDVEMLRQNQRALGGSLNNAVVYDDAGVLNREGLRYSDEFVRHKLLDAVGDCYINGHLVVADYFAVRPGHGINNLLMRKLWQTKDAWEYV